MQGKVKLFTKNEYMGFYKYFIRSTAPIAFFEERKQENLDSQILLYEVKVQFLDQTESSVFIIFFRANPQ